jgi:hypothetical protein
MVQPAVIHVLSAWFSHDALENSINERATEWMDRVRAMARAILVNLTWNVFLSSESREVSQQDVLACILEHGGLAAVIDAAEIDSGIAEEMEIKRRALWAIATWLSFDNNESRALFIRSGGIPCLVNLNEETATPEMKTFARVALSKLLCALGEELTSRIVLLRVQINSQLDLTALWDQLGSSYEGNNMSGGMLGDGQE